MVFSTQRAALMLALSLASAGALAASAGLDRDTPSLRPASDAVAAALRARSIACEVAPSAAKFGKQIRHAERRGIPFVWFPPGHDAEGTHQVKDIRSGDQVDADPAGWTPPTEDLRPRVLSKEQQ